MDTRRSCLQQHSLVLGLADVGVGGKVRICEGGEACRPPQRLHVQSTSLEQRTPFHRRNVVKSGRRCAGLTAKMQELQGGW